MNEIIKSITDAEQKAAEIKQDALLRASEISAQAEERAVEIDKLSAAECRELREKILKDAAVRAQNGYDAEISAKRAESAKYAEQCLKNADRPVHDIVRRLTVGNR